MSKCSKNFTLEELCSSATAKRDGIRNVPTAEAAVNLTILAQKVLQPLRDWWGKPILVTSGYRCPELNTAIGGVKNSQHMRGQAADLHLPSIEIGQQWYKWLKEHVEFDQLIWEKSGSSRWIHVSDNVDCNRRKAFALTV